jgi:hypothetical protein
MNIRTFWFSSFFFVAGLWIGTLATEYKLKHLTEYKLKHLTEYKLTPDCSIAQMYREMGHPVKIVDGIFMDVDNKQHVCKYIFYDHGPGAIVGGVDNCKEGHFVVSVSIPKGVVYE